MATLKRRVRAARSIPSLTHPPPLQSAPRGTTAATATTASQAVPTNALAAAAAPRHAPRHTHARRGGAAPGAAPLVYGGQKTGCGPRPRRETTGPHRLRPGAGPDCGPNNPPAGQRRRRHPAPAGACPARRHAAAAELFWSRQTAADPPASRRGWAWGRRQAQPTESAPGVCGRGSRHAGGGSVDSQ